MHYAPRRIFARMKYLLFALVLLAGPVAAQMQPTLLTKAELATKAIAEGKEMGEPFKGANTI